MGPEPSAARLSTRNRGATMRGLARLARGGGEKRMKKSYASPALVEFGPVGRLTLGEGGTEPDYGVDAGGGLKFIANNCNAGGTATACLTPPVYRSAV